MPSAWCVVPAITVAAGGVPVAIVVAIGMAGELERSALTAGAATLDSMWIAVTAADTIRGAAPVTELVEGAGGLTTGVRCELLGEVAAAGLRDGTVLGDVGVGGLRAGGVGGGGVCADAAAGVAVLCTGVPVVAEVGASAAALVAACVTCPTVSPALCTTVPSGPALAAAAVPVPTSNVRHVTAAPMPRRRCPESGCRALGSIEAV